MRRYAVSHGISAYHVADLPEPPEDRQALLFPEVGIPFIPPIRGRLADILGVMMEW